MLCRREAILFMPIMPINNYQTRVMIDSRTRPSNAPHIANKVYRGRSGRDECRGTKNTLYTVRPLIFHVRNAISFFYRHNQPQTLRFFVSQPATLTSTAAPTSSFCHDGKRKYPPTLPFFLLSLFSVLLFPIFHFSHFLPTGTKHFAFHQLLFFFSLPCGLRLLLSHGRRCRRGPTTGICVVGRRPSARRSRGAAQHAGGAVAQVVGVETSAAQCQPPLPLHARCRRACRCHCGKNLCTAHARQGRGGAGRVVKHGQPAADRHTRKKERDLVAAHHGHSRSCQLARHGW